MQYLRSPSDRLRAASKIWHAFMRATGERFDLSVFLRDTTYEKQWVDAALKSGVSELIQAARDWQDLAALPAAPAISGFSSDSSFAGSSPSGFQSTLSPPGDPAAVPSAKSKYLRGVR